jgi:hypothetical protein
MGILNRVSGFGSKGFTTSTNQRPYLVFSIAVGLCSMAAWAQEEEFGGEPPKEVSSDPAETSEEEGQEEEKISADAPETYTIQPGDTLWNLSAKFLNNPWYWPKVWSINPQIDNPNWVHPGSVIRFYKGPDEAPVQVEQVAEGGANEISSSDEEDFPEEISSDSDSDFETEEETALSETQEGPAFEGGKAATYLRKVASQTGLPQRKQFFVPDEKLKEAGRIENSPEEKKYLTIGDKVYVDLKDKPEPGTVLQVFRTVKELRHPVKMSKLGEVVALVGEIEIDAHSKGKSLATVVTAWDSVFRGDYAGVIDEEKIELVEYVPNSVEVKGYVVDSAGADSISLGGHVLVFVDKGESDGIKAGNVFSVVRSHDPLTGDTKGLTDEVIGKILVSDVRSKSSAGILVYSNRAVVRGDRIEMRMDK